MRELGRFLQSIRTIRGTTLMTMTDCIDPLVFKDVVSAVKLLCKVDGSGKVLTPSLGLKIGHSLKKLALLVRSEALQIGDESMKKKASDFVELYSSDWSAEISTFCLETLHTAKFNRPKMIPLAEDIKALSNYLEQKASTLLEELSREHPNVETWQELNEVTLAQVVLFNRRRAGETERIEKRQYEEGVDNETEMQSEIATGLSLFEQKLATSMSRVEIRGKRGRKVPVLFTKKHKERVNCLLRYRPMMNINPKNIYLFPRSGDCVSCLRSCDVLRKFAKACGAKQPALLSSTSLRKHIATISQILNLKEHEIDSLAGFLGHNINVHRDFYRLPEDTVQIAKIGKLLHELNNGSIAKHQGKSLEEIDVANEDLESDHSDSEEECVDEDNIQLSTAYNEHETTSTFGESSINGMSMTKSPGISQSKSKKQMVKKSWSAEEKAAIDVTLAKFFVQEKLPGKSEILDAQRKKPILLLRPWQQIKFFIKNKKNSKKL